MVRILDRPGYIYLAKVDTKNTKWDHNGGLYKVGQSINPKSRIAYLRYQLDLPVELIASKFVKDRFLAEKLLLERFLHDRYSPQKDIQYCCWWPTEFFVFSDGDIPFIIKIINLFDYNAYAF